MHLNKLRRQRSLRDLNEIQACGNRWMRWRKRKSMRRNHGGKQQLPDCFFCAAAPSPLRSFFRERVETERDEDRERERKREKETLTL